MEEIIHIIIHGLEDTLKMMPLVAVTYAVLDVYERSSSLNDKLNAVLNAKTGPLLGALLGCIPQCGFSFLVATIFTYGMVTPGTLVAVFIATSDEALPLFLANPNEYKMLLALIACKIVLAIVGGYLLDFIMNAIQSKKTMDVIEEEDDEDRELELSDPTCTCGNSIWYNIFTKSLRVMAYVLVINIVLGGFIHVYGEEALASMLLSTYNFQPLLAGLVGLIPNCAASIVLTELYLLDGLSFGALISGLSVGAGFGIAVLLKNKENRKSNLLLLGYLYVFSVICGYILQYVM